MAEERQDNRRPGRTLLINTNKDYSLEGYSGIQTSFETDNGSMFVVFDTVDNATSALTDLKENGVRVKYSYYKMFVKVKNKDISNMSYDDLKNLIKTKLKSVDSDVNILYFKLYKKDGNLTGSGDLVLDMKDHLDNFVKLKKLTLEGDEEVLMYRFIMNKGTRRKDNRRQRNNKVPVV